MRSAHSSIDAMSLLIKTLQKIKFDTVSWQFHRKLVIDKTQQTLNQITAIYSRIYLWLE